VVMVETLWRYPIIEFSFNWSVMFLFAMFAINFRGKTAE
jgi:hypothetical protein